MNRRLFDLCCMLPIPCTFQNLYIRLLICTETTTQFYLLSSVTVCPQGCLQMHSVPQRVGSQTVPPPRGCVSSHHLTRPHTVNALSCLEVRTFHSWVLSAFKLVPFYSSIACNRVVPVLVGGRILFFFCLIPKSVIRSEKVPHDSHTLYLHLKQNRYVTAVFLSNQQNDTVLIRTNSRLASFVVLSFTRACVCLSACECEIMCTLVRQMNIAAQIDHSVESEIWLNAQGWFPQQLLYKSWKHFGGS